MLRTLLPAVLLLLPLLSSCGDSADVTLYVALDQEHSAALIRRFEKESGLSVHARFDNPAVYPGRFVRTP